MIKDAEYAFEKFAETGEEKYFTEGFKKIENLIYNRIYRHGLGDHDDDVFQEVILGLWKALEKNYEAGHMSMKNFVSMVIKRKIINYYKYLNRKKREIDEEAISLNLKIYKNSHKTIEYYVEGDKSAESYFFDNGLIDYVEKLAEHELSKMELEVFEAMLVSYESYEDVGRMTGYNAKQIDNTLQRIRKKLKAKVLEGWLYAGKR